MQINKTLLNNLGNEHFILESLPTAVVEIDNDGIITYANARAAEVLRQPIEKLFGSFIDTVFIPLRKLARAADMILKFDRSLKCTVKLPARKEAKIGFRVIKVNDPVNHGQSRYLITMQDVGKIEAFRKEKERVRILQLGAVGKLMPSILHELKNPLAAITTAVEVLLEELSEGTVLQDVSAILAELRRMKLTFEGVGLIGQNIHSSRKESIEKAILDAFKVLSARIKQQEIEGECKVEAMPLLPFNAGMIRALIFNIITNSIHACISGDKIKLEAKLSGKERAVLEFRVSDTGKGMAPDEVTRCTEMFYTTRNSGSGIGLALCIKAVKAAHGELFIESREGKGTVVTVQLPVDLGNEL